MTSKKEKSMHKPARTQKSFGLLLLLAAAAIALLTPSGTQAAAQEPETSYSVLYNFCSQPNCADGSNPSAPLIRDEAGNLYGTAGGGTSGAGVVFKLDRKGKETVLYSFSGGADGSGPNAPLIRDEDGNLYGTTFAGGTSGVGVVFKLDSKGKFTVLYSFTGGADGSNPGAGLIRDAWGNLYGTTQYGGNSSSSSCPLGPSRCGVVFKLDTSGKETVLYSFSGGTDGANPFAGLIREEDGNLYGTASAGGDLTSPLCPVGAGCGVVFKLDSSGKETVLYTFTGGADGSAPSAPLIRDEEGNLYGTTFFGGIFNFSLCGSQCGVVFKLDPNGNETVLHTFTGGADGSFPLAGLTLRNDGRGDDDRWNPAGNLYGTTQHGGNLTSPACGPFSPAGCGVVFKLDQWGKETVLHAFQGPDGFYPPGGVLKHHGSLYGTTQLGGTNGAGVIFKIRVDDECDRERDHEWDQ